MSCSDVRALLVWPKELPVDMGCAVNAVTPEDLLRRYEESGVLDPEKKEPLRVLLPLVADNWQRGMRLGEEIHWVRTRTTDDGWGAASCWRHTHAGWHLQHVASIGCSSAVRAVLLETCAREVIGKSHYAYQHWHGARNLLAARLFAGDGGAFGPANHASRPCLQFAVPATGAADHSRQVAELPNRRCPELFALACTVRGPVYAKAEELDHDDLLLAQVDRLYRPAGLRRHRRIWVMRDRRTGAMLGAAIANRGPLGFNLSLLENRCDLLLDPSFGESERAIMAQHLLDAAKEAYQDFELSYFPATAPPADRSAVTRMGGRLLRTCTQSIWLRPGLVDWYRHVQRTCPEAGPLEHAR